MITPDVSARVLVVEDDAIVATDLRQALESLGYQVPGVFADADDILASAREHQPDVVLMDIRLPGRIDGIEAGTSLARELDIPVVYLSAHSDPATLERAKASGSWGYLVKPFDQAGLRAAIEVAIHRHRAEALTRESEEWHWCTLKSIVCAVITTDERGVITLLNPAAEHLLARPRERVEGHLISDVVTVVDERGHPLPDPVITALEEDGTVFLSGRNSLRLMEGGLHPVRGCASVIRCDGGRVRGGGAGPG
ncbi:MAG TPA: response regulator [Longimicrobiales bacterium]|jgi:AmiR/NasT family two-component response regulator